MSVKKVAGLDLSITKTGECHTGDDGEPSWSLIKTREPKDFRLPEIVKRVREVTTDCDLVLIELLPPNMKGAGITGMVQGVTRLELIEQGIRYGDVGPSSLKKYATGKGNANKGQVLEAASKRSGLDFAGDDNRADAWWLRAMARDHYGWPVVIMPASHRVALAGADWPVLPVRTEAVS